MGEWLTKQPQMLKTSTIFTGIVLIALSSLLCMPGLSSLFRRVVSTMASDYVAGTHSMAFVTAPNKEVASKLAKGLVEQKLAACVNIIPGLTSVYEWEGKIEEDSEMLLMIKTRTSRVDDISAFIRENHPYDVAEVISSPIANGNPAYLEWLEKTVPARNPAKKLKTAPAAEPDEAPTEDEVKTMNLKG